MRGCNPQLTRDSFVNPKNNPYRFPLHLDDDEDDEDDEDEGFPFALNHLKTPTVDLRSLRVVCVLKNGCKCSTAKSCKIYFRIHFSRYLRQMP